MNPNSQKSVLLLAALLAAGPLANAADSTNATSTPAAAKPLDLFANDIVATGDGVKVNRTALDEALVNIRSAAAARGQRIPAGSDKILERQVLADLIMTQILNGKATAADKTKGIELANKGIETMKENAGDEEGLQRQLKMSGVTLEELTKQFTERATAQTVLERELKVAITDDDVKKFYDDNPSQFEQPELVKAAHVLIGTRNKDGSELSDDEKKAKLKLAQDVLKRAKAGEDFAKLAKDYSDDPGSKDNGGEYTFPRGQMVPEFETAAFGQVTNQISDVVTTQFGYHIIKTLEKKPAKKLELSEVSGDIKQYLKRREMQKLVPDYVAKLEKEAHVEILDASLKAPAEDAADMAPPSAPKK
jgi:peptidyl-prolyl cis-trans isomerase C